VSGRALLRLSHDWLSRAPDRDLPSEQEEAVAAKIAVIGLKKPLQSCLHAVANADAPEINRPAMRTLFGEEPYGGADHEPVSPFAASVPSGLPGFEDGAE
jgi:hypothetical protein